VLCDSQEGNREHKEILDREESVSLIFHITKHSSVKVLKMLLISVCKMS